MGYLVVANLKALLVEAALLGIYAGPRIGMPKGQFYGWACYSRHRGVGSCSEDFLVASQDPELLRAHGARLLAAHYQEAHGGEGVLVGYCNG